MIDMAIIRVNIIAVISSVIWLFSVNKLLDILVALPLLRGTDAVVEVLTTATFNISVIRFIITIINNYRMERPVKSCVNWYSTGLVVIAVVINAGMYAAMLAVCKIKSAPTTGVLETFFIARIAMAYVYKRVKATYNYAGVVTMIASGLTIMSICLFMHPDSIIYVLGASLLIDQCWDLMLEDTMFFVYASSKPVLAVIYSYSTCWSTSQRTATNWLAALEIFLISIRSIAIILLILAILLFTIRHTIVESEPIENKSTTKSVTTSSMSSFISKMTPDIPHWALPLMYCLRIIPMVMIHIDPYNPFYQFMNYVGIAVELYASVISDNHYNTRVYGLPIHQKVWVEQLFYGLEQVLKIMVYKTNLYPAVYDIYNTYHIALVAGPLAIVSGGFILHHHLSTRHTKKVD